MKAGPRSMAPAGEGGFTLLEVMASVAVLGVGIMLVMELFSGALGLASRTMARTGEAALASEKMAEAMLSGRSGSGRAPGGLVWDVKITPLPGEEWAGLRKIVVGVGREGSGGMSYSITALGVR